MKQNDVQTPRDKTLKDRMEKITKDMEIMKADMVRKRKSAQQAAQREERRRKYLHIVKLDYYPGKKRRGKNEKRKERHKLHYGKRSKRRKRRRGNE